MSIFILANNPRNKINTSFTIFAFSLTLWVVFLLLFRHISLQYAPLIMRIVYVIGIIIGVSLWYFSHIFPEKKTFNTWPSKIMLVILLVALGLFMWPNFIVGKVYLEGTDRIYDLQPIGYFLFTFLFFWFYGNALIKIRSQLNNVAGLLKKQSTLLLIGTGTALLFGPLFNIILPSPFFKNFNYIYYGPLCTLTIVAAVAFAVAKYQFMNIKALATEMYVIFLLLLLLIDLFLAQTPQQIFFRLAILGTVVLFSYLLIRSILKEINQKEALQAANIRLQELDHQKNEFLSIAAHQLRTPLSIINGYLELIKDQAFGNQETEESLQALSNMDATNTRLTGLVNEFLDITRIEQGKTQFNFRSADVRDTISSVAEELKPRALEARLRMMVELPAQPLVANFDQDKIRHVVLNFIDNAIKYSHHGTVIVTAESEHDGIAMRVQDQGLGFEEEDRVNLFQKLYRGKNVAGTNVNGTGIGLYICSKFVEAHGGRVWAKSRGLGKGSEFGFWIPFNPKRMVDKVN